MMHGRRRGTSYMAGEDVQHNIWFGNLTERTGNTSVFYLCRLNQIEGTIKIYPDQFMLTSYIAHVISNAEELDSSVWMLDTHCNLKKWNPETDHFETVIPGGKPLTVSGKPDTIRWIKKAADNRLFINGDHTFCVYDVQKQEVKRIYESSGDHTEGRIAGNIIAATEDEKGYYWLMHTGGILTRIHPVRGHIQTFVYGKGQLAFPGAPGSVSDVFLVSHQNRNGIWFQSFDSATGSIYFLYFDLAGQNFSFYNNNFNFPDNGLTAGFINHYNFFEDRTGLLWLFTRPGMYKESPKKRQMELYRHNPGSSGSLPSDTIHFLFEDSKIRVWTGTRNGLALYQPGADNFRVFRHDPAKAATISHNHITTIQEDAEGKTWVGTANGLNLWQESTGIFRRFFHHPEKTNYCRFLFADKQQRLWLSLWNKGVFVLEKSTGKVLKSYMPEINNPAALTSRQIGTIYQDCSGNIWLGTYQAGLFRLNQAEDGFFHYRPVPGDSTSISDRTIHFIAEDGKNRLWIGANSKLNLYDPDRDCFTIFFNNTMFWLSGFCVDKHGEPWFGTYAGGGLVSVDVQQGILTAYDETKGLLHNDLWLLHSNRIAVDDFGRFWLPTQRGLSVFDPERKSFVSYFGKDGFQPYDDEYVTLKTSNGDIWIGSEHGLNRIVPADLLKKDTTLASVVITQVTINDSLYSLPDGKIFKKSVAYTDGFKLKYWQKDIGFGFVALHYLRPEDNLYSWKLENYDRDWSVPSKERKATYTNLSPGDYVFRVKASNADGVWNEEGVSIAMTILPPWWRTWLAYIVYTLLFLAALRSYTIWRVRHLRKEKELLQLKVDERTRELKKSLEEIKSTQAQLIHSEKMASLGALTAGIAHEIQNPLNFVNNFSEISNEMILELINKKEKSRLDVETGKDKSERDETSEDEILNDISKNLEKILHNGKRADAIVKGMLQHSRTNTGHKEPVNVNTLAGEYLKLSYHGMRAKDKSFNADFKIDFDPNLPKITVVPQDMGRVLLNLINNAFYAVDQRNRSTVAEQQKNRTVLIDRDQNLSGLDSETYKPVVTVSTKNLGQKIEISVRDNGDGIPEEIKDKIFQPFFTTKPAGQGTGLGLSLAYDIIKAHGGELKVESQEGEGTRFTIVLPV